MGHRRASRPGSPPSSSSVEWASTQVHAGQPGLDQAPWQPQPRRHAPVQRHQHHAADQHRGAPRRHRPRARGGLGGGPSVRPGFVRARRRRRKPDRARGRANRNGRALARQPDVRAVDHRPAGPAPAKRHPCRAGDRAAADPGGRGHRDYRKRGRVWRTRHAGGQ